MDSISLQLEQLSEHPELLKQGQTQPNQLTIFMRKWYTDDITIQHFYAWSIAFGWSMQDINSEIPYAIEKIQPSYQANVTIQQSQPNPCMFNPTVQVEKMQYLSKNEALIRQADNLIWINPSKQNQDLLDKINRPCLILMLSSSIAQLIFLLKLISKFGKQKKQLKIVTVEPIFKRLKQLSLLLSKYQSQISNEQTQLKKCYLLQPDQSFVYSNILWGVRSNCWYEPSYDLTATFGEGNNRVTYLVESKKISSTKLIYYGWKKNYISPQNYQKYTKQWDSTVIIPTTSAIYDLPISIKPGDRQKIDWYLQFTRKQVIEELSMEERDQIFNCCELMQFTPNQIINKYGYSFDYAFILLDGQFEISQCSGYYQQSNIDLRRLYGFSELRENIKQYQFTLKATTKCQLFRIARHNLNFLLYDLCH